MQAAKYRFESVMEEPSKKTETPGTAASETHAATAKAEAETETSCHWRRGRFEPGEEVAPRRPHSCARPPPSSPASGSALFDAHGQRGVEPPRRSVGVERIDDERARHVLGRAGKTREHSTPDGRILGGVRPPSRARIIFSKYLTMLFYTAALIVFLASALHRNRFAFFGSGNVIRGQSGNPYIAILP